MSQKSNDEWRKLRATFWWGMYAIFAYAFNYLVIANGYGYIVNKTNRYIFVDFLFSPITFPMKLVECIVQLVGNFISQ